MAGHNKWSKIKHRKAVVDKRRGKAWTMCSRAIIVAAKTGGGDPNFNFGLRAAMDDARYYNMPSDNVERAIKKGLGGGAGEDYEVMRYEGYGAGGVAVVIDAFTNNRARTAGDVRLLLGKHGGKLGTAGCVSHQFEQKGRVEVLADRAAGDRLMEVALEIGADDVRGPSSSDENADACIWEVICPPNIFAQVRAALEKAGHTLGDSSIEMLPLVSTNVGGSDAESLAEMIEALEENDDIKRVYSNAIWPD